jgi:hypothetical protein
MLSSRYAREKEREKGMGELDLLTEFPVIELIPPPNNTADKPLSPFSWEDLSAAGGEGGLGVELFFKPNAELLNC